MGISDWFKGSADERLAKEKKRTKKVRKEALAEQKLAQNEMKEQAIEHQKSHTREYDLIKRQLTALREERKQEIAKARKNLKPISKNLRETGQAVGIEEKFKSESDKSLKGLIESRLEDKWGKRLTKAMFHTYSLESLVSTSEELELLQRIKEYEHNYIDGVANTNNAKIEVLQNKLANLDKKAELVDNNAPRSTFRQDEKFVDFKAKVEAIAIENRAIECTSNLANTTWEVKLKDRADNSVKATVKVTPNHISFDPATAESIDAGVKAAKALGRNPVTINSLDKTTSAELLKACIRNDVTVENEQAILDKLNDSQKAEIRVLKNPPAGPMHA